MSYVKNRMNELNRYKVIHFIAAATALVPLYVLFYIVLFFLFLSDAWWIAIIALGIFLGIGFFLVMRGAQAEWTAFELPFETWNGSSHAVNKYVSQVTGPAYIINELVLFSVAQFVKGVGKIRLTSALSRLDEQRIEHLFDLFRAQGCSPRFHHHTVFSAYDIELVPLIHADMIWLKQEGKSILLGLNRKYDQAL